MHEIWLLSLKTLKAEKEGKMFINEEGGGFSGLGIEGKCPEK